MRFPSGDQAGSAWDSSSLVSCRRFPPSSAAVTMSKFPGILLCRSVA